MPQSRPGLSRSSPSGFRPKGKTVVEVSTRERRDQVTEQRIFPAETKRNPEPVEIGINMGENEREIEVRTLTGESTIVSISPNKTIQDLKLLLKKLIFPPASSSPNFHLFLKVRAHIFLYYLYICVV